MSPITSGRVVRCTFALSSSTACSPAWIEPPASPYVTVRLRLVRPPPALHGWCSDSARSVTCVTVPPFVRRFRPVRVPRLASRARPTRLRWLRAQQGVRAAGTRVLAGPCGGVGVAGGMAGLRSFVVGVDPAADALQDVFADEVVARQPDGVVPIEAGPAQPGLRLFGRADQSGQRDVAEAVRPDRAADPVGVQPVGDQLGPRGEVDAVEARPLDRRGGGADADTP